MVDWHQRCVEPTGHGQVSVGVDGRCRCRHCQADGAEHEHCRTDVARTQRPHPASDEQGGNAGQGLDPEAIGQVRDSARAGAGNGGVGFAGGGVLQAQFDCAVCQELRQPSLPVEKLVIFGVTAQAIGLGDEVGGGELHRLGGGGGWCGANGQEHGTRPGRRDRIGAVGRHGRYHHAALTFRQTQSNGIERGGNDNQTQPKRHAEQRNDNKQEAGGDATGLHGHIGGPSAG
jgi:hypothetical protein